MDQEISITKNIGVIGYGQMSSALIKGFLKSQILKPQNFYISERSQERFPLIEQLGIKKYTGAMQNDEEMSEMFEFSDVILLCVQPQQIQTVLKTIADKVQQKHLVVSIAAGITLEYLHKYLGDETRIIRVMPNTPCLVGNGVSGYVPGKNASEEDNEIVKKLFSKVGTALQITEDQIHAIIGVSGSSPAYIFMMIEAMADGGVAVGLSREQSLLLASKTVQGAAKMVLEGIQNGCTNPGVLKDRVASPGGPTITAVQKLEQLGMRNCFIQAVKVAENKSRKMEQQSEKRC